MGARVWLRVTEDTNCALRAVAWLPIPLVTTVARRGMPKGQAARELTRHALRGPRPFQKLVSERIWPLLELDRLAKRAGLAFGVPRHILAISGPSAPIFQPGFGSSIRPPSTLE